MPIATPEIYAEMRRLRLGPGGDPRGGVLKVDGEVGNKKAYDPRSWGKAAEAGMSARVVEACQSLLSAGTKLS